MRNKTQTMVSLSPWIVDEILGKYPNKSDFVQEAIIKLHLEKQNVQNPQVSISVTKTLRTSGKDKPSDNAPVVSWLVGTSSFSYFHSEVVFCKVF